MPESGTAAHLLCRVDAHRFALPAHRVRQVHRAVAIDPLPGAPDSVMGIVDVHVELVPVLALRHRLGLPPADVGPDDVLVHLDVRGRAMLVLVDAAEDVASIPPEAIRRADDVVPGARHLQGVMATGGDVLVIHDVDTFLTGAELLDVDAALARLRPDGAGSPE